MAKKVGVSKAKPKSEAIPLGTKKPAKKVPKPKAAKAAVAEFAAVGGIPGHEVSHQRDATAGEIDLIAKRRAIVIKYLQQRDGMDPDTATTVVESMEPEDIGDLYQEAQAQVTTNEPPAEQGAVDGAVLAEPVDEEFPDFTTVPALLTAEEDFPAMVLAAVGYSKTKNSAEKQYKALKEKIDKLMADAGVVGVQALGIKLERYKGKSPKQLDPQKLLEKGVSIDIINQCYKSTEYDDVRFTVPKAQ